MTLTYDAQNRLASITKNGITTKFIYDGIDLIAEYDGNNNLLRKYVHGGGIDEPLVWYEGTGTSDKRFIISDHQGSVIATTNAAGTVLNISTYSPYGERTNTNAAYASRFGYTGQADLPELNLQYYKARIYDPKLGRFLQSDPIGYEAGMNIYAYVLGDPVNATDPLGLQVEATITAPRLTDDQKCERQYGAGNCYSGGGEYTLPFWVREERPSDFDGVPDFIIPQYGKGGGGSSDKCAKATGALEESIDSAGGRLLNSAKNWRWNDSEALNYDLTQAMLNREQSILFGAPQAAASTYGFIRNAAALRNVSMAALLPEVAAPAFIVGGIARFDYSRNTENIRMLKNRLKQLKECGK